jgi:GntR family transcriptional regulator
MTARVSDVLLIDRDSSIPIYQQIINDITGRIAREEWEIGGRLPSESALASQYGVSRVTLRQALAALEADSLIERHRGQGAFVSANPRLVIEDLAFPTIYSGKRAGADPKKPTTRSKTLRISTLATPDKKVCSKLGVPPDEKLIYLRRLFFRDERAIGINDVWFPRKAVPGLVKDGLIDQSVSKTLRKRYHYRVVAIENYIEAIILDTASAQLLGVSYAASALRIDSTYFLAKKTPVEYSSTIWAGDTTRFHFLVTKDAR